jgi:hypothetical protein
MDVSEIPIASIFRVAILEATNTSEISLDLCQTTRHNISENIDIHIVTVRT